MTKTLLAGVFAAAMFAGPAFAQAAAPYPPQGVPVPPPPGVHGQFGGRMQGGDRTRQQAQAMAGAMFQRFDLNRDGILTRDEAQQALAQAEASRGGDDGEQGGGRAERMIDRMFGGAPSVTLQQFEAQALARFDRQDLNRDGVVTADERQQARAYRGQ